MTILEVSKATGLPVKTIRYYEEVGLVRPRRLANGYRAFSEADCRDLSFLAQARSLGFSLQDCRALLELRASPARASADVKAIAQSHLASIDDRIAALEMMRSTLEGLMAACAGDGGAACGILEGIEAASRGPTAEAESD